MALIRTRCNSPRRRCSTRVRQGDRGLILNAYTERDLVRLKQRYDAKMLVDLVAFAGIMIARLPSSTMSSRSTSIRS